MKEVELRAPVVDFLTRRGYRCYVDPDGHDYLDLVAVRGREVGMVELKVADWRRVQEQALLRRGWGTWVALVLPRRSLAERVAAHPRPPKGDRIGVWYLDKGEVVELRVARPMVGPGEVDPFPGLKEHLLESLKLLDAGVLTPDLPWLHPEIPSRTVISRRRVRGKTWRLEEFPAEPNEEAAGKGDGRADR